MFFSVAPGKVSDPETGIELEFIPDDTATHNGADYRDSSICGLRIYNPDDPDNTTAHFRFRRNGTLISVVEEKRDEQGRVMRREMPVAQSGVRQIPVAGGAGETVDVQTPGAPMTVGDREGLDFQRVRRPGEVYADDEGGDEFWPADEGEYDEQWPDEMPTRSQGRNETAQERRDRDYVADDAPQHDRVGEEADEPMLPNRATPVGPADGTSATPQPRPYEEFDPMRQTRPADVRNTTGTLQPQQEGQQGQQQPPPDQPQNRGGNRRR